MRPPTLEATRNSKIVATGAKIPGDLPFQFAKADDNSLITMAGLTVTKNEDGTISVVPGNELLEFPHPTDEFSSLSNSEIKIQLQQVCIDLVDLQERFFKDSSLFSENNGPPSNEDYNLLYQKYASEYNTEFSEKVLSLCSEILRRLKRVAPDTHSTTNGARIILRKAFVGPNPASDAAEFLEYLGKELGSK